MTHAICDRIWEKALKLRLEILRVNQDQKSFFFSMTKNYPFPIFSPNLKSNHYRESALTAPFPRETIKKRYLCLGHWRRRRTRRRRTRMKKNKKEEEPRCMR